MICLAQDAEDLRHKDCPTSDFLFDRVDTGEADHASSQSSGQHVVKSPTLGLTCYREEGNHAELLGLRTSGRMVMPYFPPLSMTVDASTSSAASAAAAAIVNVGLPLERVANSELRTVIESEYNRTHHVDTSLEAVRGSPCEDSNERAISSCDSTTPARGPNHRREGYCVSADATSKSGTNRLTRETGRGDLRHTFSGSQDVGCQPSFTVRDRDVFRAHHGRTADNWHCTTSTRVHRRCQRRLSRSRCRCRVKARNFVVDLQAGRSLRDPRRAVLPPRESQYKTRVKRPERYFDRVRKRTLVNRLKQFSGCFCDTGCGRRMRTLANV